MASAELEVPLLSFDGDSFPRVFGVGIEEAFSARADVLPGLEASKPAVSSNKSIPKPPPLPSVTYKRHKHSQNLSSLFSSVAKEKIETWDNLFKEGLGADAYVFTEDGAHIRAHSSILAAASPVLGNLINQSRAKNGMRYIKIPSVPYEAVYAFIHFLYSSCYEEEEAKKFVLHLLVLSHCYSIPSLKRTCVHILEQGWLNDENVIDVLQLAQRCDVPRIYFICVSMVVKNFKSVSLTEGWKVMRRTNPSLEQELVEAVIEADTRKQERAQKLEERKVYLQLYEAMEALLHICRDGCRTIGPRDKALKGSHVACKFPACKGLEALVRHFSGCKTRVPGGCSRCKRMWQLFELHSRICRDPDSCKVPLCRHLKEKMKQHSKKDETRWKVLVTNVLAAKNTLGPFSSRLSGLL